jgi:hypothetical protein
MYVLCKSIIYYGVYVMYYATCILYYGPVNRLLCTNYGYGCGSKPGNKGVFLSFLFSFHDYELYWIIMYELCTGYEIGKN